MSTAGLVIIGNEVLSGKVEEQNARFVIQELRDAGVTLMRVVVIRDDIATIARDVREMSSDYDHVFTSGGVGATHDDVTLEGIARAFDVPLEQHPELVSLLEEFGMELNAAALRMATVPAGSELHQRCVSHGRSDLSADGAPMSRWRKRGRGVYRR